MLPEDTALGRLYIDEMLFEYDGPRLFIAKNDLNQQFLVNCIDEDIASSTETYLYVEISDMRRESINSGEVSLREAYTKAEHANVYILTTNYASDIIQTALEVFQVSDIKEEWLPLPEASLGTA